MKGKTSKTRVNEIKNSLIKQLQTNGITENHYMDLINDYCDFFEIKNKLIEDVKARGVSIEYNHGGGQSGYKKNDSIDQLVRVNATQLKILSELGIRGADVKVVEPDEEL